MSQQETVPFSVGWGLFLSRSAAGLRQTGARDAAGRGVSATRPMMVMYYWLERECQFPIKICGMVDEFCLTEITDVKWEKPLNEITPKMNDMI